MTQPTSKPLLTHAWYSPNPEKPWLQRKCSNCGKWETDWSAAQPCYGRVEEARRGRE